MFTPAHITIVLDSSGSVVEIRVLILFEILILLFTVLYFIIKMKMAVDMEKILDRLCGASSKMLVVNNNANKRSRMRTYFFCFHFSHNSV